MTKKKLSIALAFATGALSSAATYALEPQPIEAGAFDLIPTLNADFRHTDNMFKSATNEVSSNLWVLSPQLQAIADTGNSSLTLTARVDEGNYSATNEDDYTDWLVGAAAHLGMPGNTALDLNASLFSTREARGEGFSQGGFLPTSPDEYEETNYGGDFTLGTNETFGRLVLGLNSYDKSYENNRATTVFRDREDFRWSGALYLNMSSRTAIVLEYINTDIDYGTDPLTVVGSPDSLDSDETYYYVGVTWEATGKTTGTLKVGNGEKEFDDADRITSDETSWQAEIRWEPLTYSVFNFTASKDFGEATGVGNNLEARRYGINWQHAWSDALSTTVGYNRSDDEYSQSTREDEITNAVFRLDYSVQRWLDVFVSYSADERESNFANFNYDENVAAIGFAASL